MSRTCSRPRPTQAQTLRPVATHCPECGYFLWEGYSNCRTGLGSALFWRTNEQMGIRSTRRREAEPTAVLAFVPIR